MFKQATAWVAVAALFPFAATAVPVSYNGLSFQTADQSIWDTGDSFILNETKFIGAQWSGLSTNLDLLAGSENARVPGTGGTVPNPLYAAWVLCGGPLGNPLCGDAPSTTIPNPIPAATFDSRFGAEVIGTSNGKIGFNFGLSIDSGSVDATVSYDAELIAPDYMNANPFEPFSLNPNSTLAGVNTLETNFSELSAYAEAVMQLSGEISATGCPFIGTCYEGSTPYNIDFTPEIISFNQDGTGGVELFDGLFQPSDFGVNPLLDGFPLSFDIAGLAEITLYQSQPDTSGGLNAGTQTLQSTGQDDLLDLILDLDNIVATAAGVPGLFGSSFDIPVLGSVGFDIINVAMGPTIDLQQNFELEPTLWVDLLFSKPVEVGGIMVTSLSSAWDNLPDISFGSGETWVTPEFYLSSYLNNDTLLDFDLAFMIDLLQIYYDFGLAGSNSFGIGNVLDEAISLFDTPAFYSNRFELLGFNRIAGDPFLAKLPEPGTLLLYGLGLFGLGYAARRKAKAAA